MKEEKDRYFFGNSFNEVAYDKLIEVLPELRDIIKKNIELDIEEIKNTELKVVTLPKATTKSGSIIGCEYCHNQLDSSSTKWASKEIIKCGVCGTEFYEYNSELTLLDKSRCGIIFRALQGIEHYLTMTIKDEWRKKLNKRKIDEEWLYKYAKGYDGDMSQIELTKAYYECIIRHKDNTKIIADYVNKELKEKELDWYELSSSSIAKPTTDAIIRMYNDLVEDKELKRMLDVLKPSEYSKDPAMLLALQVFSNANEKR